MKRRPKEKRLVLIPAGRTEWSGQDRIQGNTILPVSDEGRAQVNAWIGQFTDVPIGLIYSGKSDPGAETARLIGKALKVKVRQDDALAEVNLGLWQGMPISALREKQPTVYKQWREHPEQVVPPNGESFQTARDRLDEVLGRALRANKAACVAVVLGEMSWALARLTREGREAHQLWELLKDPLTWHQYLINYDNG